MEARGMMGRGGVAERLANPAFKMAPLQWRTKDCSPDCIQAILCRKFRLNTTSRNIYFEFFKISGFTRTRVPPAEI
jgi:hypothetical protein